MKKYVIIVLILVLLIGSALAFTDREGDVDEGRVMSLESYVLQQLPEISPEKPVLGGTFYITDFEADNGRGTVAYEDGHNAFVADFTYSTAENGAMSITSFTLRE